MSLETEKFQAQINGLAATTEQLVPLAFSGFAHFTAMQVRNRKVKGLDLHLARLQSASIAFFGRALPDELLKSYIKTAVNTGPEDQSLMVTIFSRQGEFTAQSMDAEPAVLVRTAPPSDGPKGSLRLKTVSHERSLATIKHVGEAGKTFYLHEAIRQGFDDAVFVDRQGRLSEATIWNLVFWDGETVIWPKAEMLTGTMMGIVQRQLKRLGIPQRSEEITLERISGIKGAAVMNSWTPGIPVKAIASSLIPEAKLFVEWLHKAFEAEPASSL
ncbi:aminotransferase class IV family protein [Pseudochrobactrum asaccharolyticum]|uniref:Probable branched-chain-amino-acid aminotransferase n=1 Tax=Pseudochrobactrum asaccharolyticum TaxID=354351 RepID=A0A366E5P1_9HYPH|nr:aminotransferase class IV family protein [Pseudochrobactrum asaccharolyticum]RBO97622.1 branched-subunit amino acid aminotransferase/4-amino-4-deoxychorismate lyase [Pseudochrobactrum asaccharolyticum]